MLVALGYADGILRVASNKAPVKVGDTTGRITGRIAMDQFVVDIGDDSAAPGDSVVLFGDPALGEPTRSRLGGRPRRRGAGHHQPARPPHREDIHVMRTPA